MTRALLGFLAVSSISSCREHCDEYLYINPQAISACRGDFGEDNVFVSGGEAAVSPRTVIWVENSDGVWRMTYADENGGFGLTTSEEQAYLRVLIDYNCNEGEVYKVELNLEVQESCSQE